MRCSLAHGCGKALRLFLRYLHRAFRRGFGIGIGLGWA
jgi:hypothetical protein